MPDQPADYPSFRLRLNAILEEDWQAGSLVLSRQGKISRLHYTRSLGMAKSNATPHLDLFERYENLTGSTAPETRPLVIAARKWLEAAMSEGTLELRDDKVSRLQLCRAIGCSAASLRRDEGLILLLSEFDQRVSGMGYLPADVLAKMDELISFLSRSRLLDNDHKSVNQTAAAEAIGLPLSLLKRKPFLPIIQHFDALYMEDVLGDTTTVYLHGRPWKFAGLLRGAWKIGFVEKLAVAFRSLAETRVSGTSKEIYASALSFTEFVADGSRSGAGEMVALLNDGKQPDGVLWENLAFAYRDELYELNQPTTADKKVSSANVLLRGFHDNGIAPLLSCPLGRRRGGRVGNHRPTVVEARTPQTKFSTATHLTDFAAEALQRAASRYEVDLDGADSSGFLATLAQSYEEYGDDVVNNPSFVILDIIKKRLDAIENHAIGIVKRWRDHYDSIAYFLSIANISDKDLDELLRAKETEYRRHVREFFPRPEVNFRLGVGNLVAVARSKFSGLLPSQQFKLDEGRKAFFAKRYLEYGGFENLDAYLRPHNDAVHATLTLYGTASGSNNAVGLTLDHEAIEISDIPGYDRVTGKKARARGKPIIVDLESDGACISAMRWIQEASSPVRDRVESEAERRDLFVVRYGERCQALTAFTHNGWFKEFTSQISAVVGSWQANPEETSARNRSLVYAERAKAILDDAWSRSALPITRRRVCRKWIVKQLGCGPSAPSQSPRLSKVLKFWDAKIAEDDSRCLEVIDTNVVSGRNDVPVRHSGRTLPSRVVSPNVVLFPRNSAKIESVFIECEEGGFVVPSLVWQDGLDIEVNDWLRSLVVDDGNPYSTAHEYAKILRPFVNFRRQQHFEWDEVDDELLRRWRAARRKEGVTPQRFNTCLAVVFQFYSWLQSEGRLHFHVQTCAPSDLPDSMIGYRFPISAEKVKIGKWPSRGGSGWASTLRLPGDRGSVGHRHTPTEEETRRIHTVVQDSEHAVRDSLLFSYAEETGGRRKEILSILKSQLPTEREVERLIEEDRPWHITIERKGGGSWELILLPDLVMRTWDYIKAERQKIVDERGADPPEVFLSERGEVLKADSLTKIGSKAFTKAGVKNANGHRLRAKFLLAVIEALIDAIDIDPVQILPGSDIAQTILVKARELMGHTSIESLRPYLNFALERRVRLSHAFKLRDLEARVRQLTYRETEVRRRLKAMEQLDVLLRELRNGGHDKLAEKLQAILSE